MADLSKSTLDPVIRVAYGLRDKGLVAFEPPTVTATESGHQIADAMLEHERAILHRFTEEWPGSDCPEVSRLVEDIANRLSTDEVPLARG